MERGTGGGTYSLGIRNNNDKQPLPFTSSPSPGWAKSEISQLFLASRLQVQQQNLTLDHERECVCQEEVPHIESLLCVLIQPSRECCDTGSHPLFTDEETEAERGEMTTETVESNS